MSEESIPNEILVVVGSSQPDLSDLEYRRSPGSHQLPNVEAVQLTQLQGQVNIFLQQLDQIMKDTPKEAGEFKLTEFEVTAGLVLEAKGKISLALLANAEVGGSVNAGLKFVFKRS
jgi:hypothetical protein